MGSFARDLFQSAQRDPGRAFQGRLCNRVHPWTPRRAYSQPVPKSEGVDGARRRLQLPNTVEGQIAELCRDLAVEAKRMRQMQEQADELRTAIRRWAGQSEPDSERDTPSRAGPR